MKMKSLYIHGQATGASSGETFATNNPATGEKLAEIGQASAQDVDRTIASAHEGFKVWSAMSGMERGRILMRAVAILRERNDELAKLEVKDTGKPIQEAIEVDIVTGADVIEYYAGLAAAIQGQQQDLGHGQFFYTAVSHWVFVPELVRGTIPFRLRCGNRHRHWLPVMHGI